VHRTLERVRAEFLDMPGLQLNSAQMARLCGVDGTICKAVLDALVDAKFLRVSVDGAYARLTDGEMVRPRRIKAEHAPPRDEHRRRTA
jgi:hypothetical protein